MTDTAVMLVGILFVIVIVGVPVFIAIISSPNKEEMPEYWY